MAEVRYVKTRTWRDAWFASLNQREQHLFIFLITNESTSLSGFYEMPLENIAMSTKNRLAELKSALKKLESRVLVTDGWVCIKNYALHQNASKSPKIQKLIEYDLGKVPEGVKRKASEHFTLLHSHSHSHSHSDGIDRVSIPYTPSPEKNEDEKEEKHPFGIFKNVMLTIEEKEALKETYGVATAKKLVDDCSTYLKSHGKEKKYRSHYATILNWARRDGVAKVEKPKEVVKEPEMTEEERKKSEEMRGKVSAFVRNGMRRVPRDY